MRQQRPQPRRVHAVTTGLLLSAFVCSLAAAQTTDCILPTSNALWTCPTPWVPEWPDTSQAHCQQEDAEVTWHLEDGDFSFAGQLNILFVLEQRIDAPSDINVDRNTYHEREVQSDTWRDDATDIIFQSRNSLPGGAIGVAWCAESSNDDVFNLYDCEQHIVAFSTATPWQSLICHEVGHAVGLMHGAQCSPALSQIAGDLGCMRTPDNPGVTFLGSLNINNINSVY